MNESRIRTLLGLGKDEAGALVDAILEDMDNGIQYRNSENWKLYNSICEEIRQMVTDYDVRLPLNVLQFYFYPRKWVDHKIKKPF